MRWISNNLGYILRTHLSLINLNRTISAASASDIGAVGAAAAPAAAAARGSRIK